MKTREERANKYAKARVDKITRMFTEAEETIQMLRDLIAQSHIAGAESEHAELTRWNDPDESRPENLQRVLVKYKKADGSTKVGIATFHNPFSIGRGSFVMEAARTQYIIGWREIHE